MEPRPLTTDQLRALAGLVAETRHKELTCDEWVHAVAGYLDAQLEGAPSSPESELVAEHIALCSECREEFEALLAALRAGE